MSKVSGQLFVCDGKLLGSLDMLLYDCLFMKVAAVIAKAGKVDT